MRFVLVSVLALVAACKTANPNVCCVTDAQCADLGVDDMRPCKAGQACSPDNTCIASECSDSSECTSAGAPVCVNNLCVASCSVDADCAGSPSGELCADDGVCVGCKSNADCDANAPFCDQEDRQCRGCERDSECPGGVCLEADATCVADSTVLFVSPTGDDSGDCPRGAPCQTIPYALTKAVVGRRVVHLDGGSTNVGTSSVNVSGIYLDGTNTAIEGGNATSIFTVNQGMFTASGIEIPAGAGNAITTTGLTGRVRLFGAKVRRPVTVTSGTIDVARSEIADVNCMSGTLSVMESQIIEGRLESMSCQVTVARNRFTNRQSRAFSSFGGLVVFENNLVVITDQNVDAVSLQSGVGGSTARFNTIVNTTTVTTTDSAISCDASIEMTSNIIAYNSTSPIVNNSGCVAKYTLFDAVTDPSDSAGEGNQVGDAATFFADRDAQDFHLSPQSPARGLAQPGLPVTQDLDGNVRPNQAADAGAFEAP